MNREKNNLFFKHAPGTVCLPNQSPYQPSRNEAKAAAASRLQGGGEGSPMFLPKTPLDARLTASGCWRGHAATGLHIQDWA